MFDFFMGTMAFGLLAAIVTGSWLAVYALYKEVTK